MTSQVSAEYVERPGDALVTWTKVIYALHAFSLITGIIGTATIVGAFLTGWPSIIAVILNYIKRSEVRGHGSNRIFDGRYGRSGSDCSGLRSASGSSWRPLGSAS
jgi:hypothetical protein